MSRRRVAKGRAARERRYESAVRRQIALHRQTHHLWMYADPVELLRRGDTLARFECFSYFCPTVGEVECCSWHCGFDVCCTHPELHEPLRVVTAVETREIGAALGEFLVTAGHPLTCNGGNLDGPHHDHEVIMLLGERGLICPECARVQELPKAADWAGCDIPGHYGCTPWTHRQCADGENCDDRGRWAREDRPEMLSDRLGYAASVGDDDWVRIQASTSRK